MRRWIMRAPIGAFVRLRSPGFGIDNHAPIGARRFRRAARARFLLHERLVAHGRRNSSRSVITSPLRDGLERARHDGFCGTGAGPHRRNGAWAGFSAFFFQASSSGHWA